jgi:undecaprenyl-diphosphatase
MSFLHLLALSVVQGLTEFLPVSSSGHLALFPHVFGEADQGILIDVALHVGTLMAILVYYFRDVFGIAHDVLLWRPTPHRNLGLYIAAGSVPAVLAGLAIHEMFPEGIRSTLIIAVNLIVFGILMGVADKIGTQEKGIEKVTLKSAFLIGLAQAMALIPGVSRSGMTITTARFMGFKRTEAARFSFLLGIPAMTGAGLLSFLQIAESNAPGLWQDALLAIVLAFFAGLAAIHFMMRWLGRAGLMPFVAYRVLLGIILLIWFV